MAAFIFCSKPFKTGRGTREILLGCVFHDTFRLFFFFSSSVVSRTILRVWSRLWFLIITSLMNLHIYSAHSIKPPFFFQPCQKGNSLQFRSLNTSLWFFYFQTFISILHFYCFGVCFHHQAKGFELSYLEKVPEVKDTVHKQSLLHHTCSIVVEKFPDSTDLYSEIGAITRLTKVYLYKIY